MLQAMHDQPRQRRMMHLLVKKPPRVRQTRLSRPRRTSQNLKLKRLLPKLLRKKRRQQPTKLPKKKLHQLKTRKQRLSNQHKKS
jgi:hypothetical protein